MSDLRDLFEKDAMERYKVPIWLVQDRRDGESYNVDSGSILSHLHWEWQAWKRCRESLLLDAMQTSVIGENEKLTINKMRSLAAEILDVQSDNPESRGDEIIHLYDAADTIFGAENIQTVLCLLDTLNIANETPVQLPEKIYTTQVAGYIATYREEIIKALEKAGKKWNQG